MKRNLYIIGTLLAGILSMTSCSQDEELFTAPSEYSFLQINVTDTGVQSDASSRAITDANYMTTFEEGDRIGLIAISNSAVVEGYNNLCLKLQNGAWVNEDGSGLIYSSALEGAVYYAYYPYSSSFVINDDLTTPLSTLVANWVIDYSKTFAENDLMASSGAEATKVAGGYNYALNLNMQHQMGMIVVETVSGTVYNLTDSEGNDLGEYVIADEMAAPTFQINGADVTAEELGSTYRILVQPGATNLSILYNEKTYTKSDIAVTAQNYFAYQVGEAGGTINHVLKVGDYYLADGNLMSYNEETEAPSNAVGVIYYVGNAGATDLKLAADHPNCKHGLAIALKNASDAVAVFSDNQYQYGIPGEGSVYTAAAGMTSILGYNNTAMAQIDPEFKGATEFISTLQTYSQTTMLPTVSSGWYLPSFHEYQIMIANYDAISASLREVGSSLTKYPYDKESGTNEFYWTSTERNNYMQAFSDMQTVTSTISTTSSHKLCTGSASAVKGSGIYRFAFAF